MGEIEFQRPIGATGARLLQLCGPGDYQARSLPRGDRALSPGARRICRQLKGKKGSNYVLCDVKLAGHRVKTATSLIVTSGFGPACVQRNYKFLKQDLPSRLVLSPRRKKRCPALIAPKIVVFVPWTLHNSTRLGWSLRCHTLLDLSHKFVVHSSK